MAKIKSTAITPLQLLHELTAALLGHFEQACAQALAEAEKILSKLEKKQSKVQVKLSKQRGRIESAASGKRKARTKARAKISELDQALFDLQIRADETRQYISDLKHDIQISLTLVQGVVRVREAAVEAVRQRHIVSSTTPEAQSDVNARPNAKRKAATPRVTKKAATLKATANAVVASPVVTVTNVKPRKHAPSEVAPLAIGVAEASSAADPDEPAHTVSALEAEWIEHQS